LTTKRLGRYHDLSTGNSNNDNSDSKPNFNELMSLYKENSRKPLLDWDKPLFGYRRSSLQKVLANANKTIELALKFYRFEESSDQY
jgi:hypothetical protein